MLEHQARKGVRPLGLGGHNLVDSVAGGKGEPGLDRDAGDEARGLRVAERRVDDDVVRGPAVDGAGEGGGGGVQDLVAGQGGPLGVAGG